jgi:hypothetical protein
MTFAETAAIFGGSETASPEAPANTAPTYNGDPLWILDADAVFLQRSGLRLPEVGDGPGTSSLNFPVAAGFEIDLIRQHIAGTDWSLEGAYLGVDSFHTQEIAEIPNIGYFSGDYQSALRSVELNARRDWNDWLTVLAGVRFINLTENVAAREFSAEPPMFFDIPQGQSTNNQLVGFQLGADARVLERDRFKIDFISKAGIYANRATNTYPFFGGYFLNTSTDQATFEGELKIAATYSITDAFSFNGAIN